LLFEVFRLLWSSFAVQDEIKRKIDKMDNRYFGFIIRYLWMFFLYTDKNYIL
jgi:hypothetical protein